MTKRKATIDLRDHDAEGKPPASSSSSSLIASQDLGHRVGNFHNYYAFHPTSHRLEKMKGMLEYIGKYYKRNAPDDRCLFEYCDLGCNEGDLTIELSGALQKELQTNVHFCGVDIDPVLIERATEKARSIRNEKVTGDFRVGNICHEMKALLESDSVDMTSLLSTTMWIHVHAGDEGLRNVLENLCRRTRKFLLIEPQPSKCYRKAVTRLRKIGRPEMDVSSDRLKLRPNIENEIDVILSSCGFTKVSLSSSTERTQWHRSLQLYERAEK